RIRGDPPNPRKSASRQFQRIITDTLGAYANALPNCINTCTQNAQLQRQLQLPITDFAEKRG
ncbi:MAG: hypothetical protein ABI625_27665, partial [bacterium]